MRLSPSPVRCRLRLAAEETREGAELEFLLSARVRALVYVTAPLPGRALVGWFFFFLQFIQPPPRATDWWPVGAPGREDAPLPQFHEPPSG